MIVFQVQPNRLYPKVISHILEHTNITSENFQHAFLLKRPLEQYNINNIIGAIPMSQKHDRDVDLLYGVFGHYSLNLQDQDFVFTLLSDPLCLPYDTYALYSAQFDLKAMHKSNFDDQASLLMRKNPPKYSLEEFIDLVIDDHQFTFKNNNLKFYLIKEVTHGFPNHDYFDYIGKYSHINHLFHTLNERFNFNIPFINQKDLREYAFTGERYKIDILAEKFKKQLKFYKNLDKIYQYNEIE